MEPTLRDGDIIFVRKCDAGALVDAVMRFLVSSEGETERARVRRYEQLQSQYVPASKIYERPPTALAGHIVVYKDPEKAFPTELAVKRVVALGGQWLRLPASETNTRRLQSLPAYTLHVEGDNRDNSRDSRHVGPISKNLLVGVAEYVVWPPTRWQRIQRKALLDDNDKPRAFWP
jgi:signal peptidase I